MKHGILLVDDETNIVDALERIFRKDFEVFKATSGELGLEVLRSHPHIAVIVSDQRMPNMTGVDFLTQSIESHPESMRILLTGYTDIDSVVSAVNSGQIYRYITKPWDPIDLKNTVDKAVEKFELSAELKRKNRELKIALAELQSLDQAKTQFMMLINHELKSPLTVMMSFLDLLKESGLNPDQSKFVTRVSSSVDKLRLVVDDSLEFILAQTGQEKIEVKAIPLSDFSLHIKSTLERTKLADRTLRWSGFETPVKIWSDIKVVDKIFMRLLDNVKKFSTPDSLIEIGIEPLSSTQIRIWIENEGREIPEEMIAQVKKPFVISENMMNHSKGWGLGLSIAEAWSKNLNSHLEIQCKEGKVCVALTLPKIQSEVESRNPGSNPI